MRIITNERLIKRYSKLGQYLVIFGMAIIVVYFYLSSTGNENLKEFQTRFSLLLLFGPIVALITLFVGISLGNRYGGFPSYPILLNKALKGLDDKYSLYHFIAPTGHLLVGPAGLLLLFPKRQAGTITFKKNRWRQEKLTFIQSYLKFFGFESIGRPDLEIGAEIEGVRKFISKQIPETPFPDPQAVLIFTNEKAILAADDAPIPTIRLDKLKDHVRKGMKGNTGKLTAEQIAAVTAVLERGIPAQVESGEE